MEELTALVFEPGAARQARILRMLEAAHGEYRFWHTALLYGGWISAAVGICGVPLFGLWWRAVPLMWAAFIISAGLGALVLATAGMLRLSGRMSCWLLVSDERVDLGDTELTYRVTRRNRRVLDRGPGVTYVWAMPYANITRLDYDRGAKTLRVHGRFREEGCRKPAAKVWPRAPQGMVEMPNPERRQDKDFFLDIPLYYDDSAALLQELERRADVFIFPAMRGDDYADLRDLPGLPPKRPALQLLALFLMMLCLGTLLVALDARRAAQSPWQPYPPAAAEALTQIYGLYDSVVLDGCRITLERAAPGQNGGLNISFLFENLNEDMSVLLHLGKKEPNIIASADTPQGRKDCNYIPPDNPLVQLAPGGAYHYDVLYALPNETDVVTLEINSDRWASGTRFWEPEYVGRMIVVNGMETLHNRIRFQIRL